MDTEPRAVDDAHALTLAVEEGVEIGADGAARARAHVWGQMSTAHVCGQMSTAHVCGQMSTARMGPRFGCGAG